MVRLEASDMRTRRALYARRVHLVLPASSPRICAIPSSRMAEVAGLCALVAKQSHSLHFYSLLWCLFVYPKCTPWHKIGTFGLKQRQFLEEGNVFTNRCGSGFGQRQGTRVGNAREVHKQSPPLPGGTLQRRGLGVPLTSLGPWRGSQYVQLACPSKRALQ
jgi:hypothetical protein